MDAVPIPNVVELTPDVKRFLLKYPMIDTGIVLAKREVGRIIRAAEADIACQSWFDAKVFRTAVSDRMLQVWDARWRYDVSPGCPWIHFEFSLNWENSYIEGRLDIEGQRTVPHAVSQAVGTRLAQTIQPHATGWMQGTGWNIHVPLVSNAIFLWKRTAITEDTFSSAWMVAQSREHMNQLADLIPDINQTVEQIFPHAKKH